MGHFFIERVFTFAVFSAFAQHERLDDRAQQFRRQFLRWHQHRFCRSVISRICGTETRYAFVIASIARLVAHGLATTALANTLFTISMAGRRVELRRHTVPTVLPG